MKRFRWSQSRGSDEVSWGEVEGEEAMAQKVVEMLKWIGGKEGRKMTVKAVGK